MTEYKQGFLDKCAELGYEPNAVWSFAQAFIKEAQNAETREDNERIKEQQEDV